MEVYLDNAAATPVRKPVAEAYGRWLRELMANPAAAHGAAIAVRRHLDTAARRLLGALGIDEAEGEVIWTSGGSEANILALQTVNEGRATSAAEHSSALAVEAVRLPVDAGGQLCLDTTPPARLLGIHQVQNETGVIQDLPVIRAWLDKQAPRALLHVDAVQAAGKLPIPWAAARIDLLSLSAHKLHAPPGVGALIRRRGRTPPIARHGSTPAAAVLAFVHALELAVRERETEVRRIGQLAAALRAGLATRPVQVVSPPTASPWICCFCVPEHDGAILARLMSEDGVHVGTGSACRAESAAPSHVLSAMGIAPALARGALRVSFGRRNTAADIERLFAAFDRAVARY